MAAWRNTHAAFPFMNSIIQVLQERKGMLGFHNLVACEVHCRLFDVVNKVSTLDACEVCQQEAEAKFIKWQDKQTWIDGIIYNADIGPIYIAGPMSGFPNDNKESFWRMERLLKRYSISVLSPANYEGEHTYEWYMEQDIKKVLEAKGCVFLVGWQNSRGANLEHQVAEILKKQVYYEV